MLLHLLFVTLITTATASSACDADVLRLNYRKTSATKPTVKPPTVPPKTTDEFHKNSAPRIAHRIDHLFHDPGRAV